MNNYREMISAMLDEEEHLFCSGYNPDGEQSNLIKLGLIAITLDPNSRYSKAQYASIEHAPSKEMEDFEKTLRSLLSPPETEAPAESKSTSKKKRKKGKAKSVAQPAEEVPSASPSADLATAHTTMEDLHPRIEWETHPTEPNATDLTAEDSFQVFTNNPIRNEPREERIHHLRYEKHNFHGENRMWKYGIKASELQQLVDHPTKRGYLRPVDFKPGMERRRVSYGEIRGVGFIVAHDPPNDRNEVEIVTIYPDENGKNRFITNVPTSRYDQPIDLNSSTQQ